LGALSEDAKSVSVSKPQLLNQLHPALGLLPTPQATLSDITPLHVARSGVPAAVQQVLIVTRPHKDGWEQFDHETREIVPDKPADHQAAAIRA